MPSSRTDSTRPDAVDVALHDVAAEPVAGRSGSSRLTASPAPSGPSEVRRSVSSHHVGREAGAVAAATAVRQTPLTATESPWASSAASAPPRPAQAPVARASATVPVACHEPGEHRYHSLRRATISTSSSIRSTSDVQRARRVGDAARRRSASTAVLRLAPAEHDRRDEHARLVDLARLEEGAGQVRPALEQQRLDVARAELVERVAARGRASFCAGGDDHVDARDSSALQPRALGGARADDGHRHLGGASRRAASRAAGAPRSRTRRGAAGARLPRRATVSSGSSASAVPMPTATASRLGAPAVRAGPARLAGDPLRVAGAGGDLAVERHRRLEDHERAARAGVLAERLVEQARGLGHLAVDPARPSMPSSRRMPGPRPGRLRRSGRRRRSRRARCRPRRSRRCRAACGPGGSRARATRTASRRPGPPRRRASAMRSACASPGGWVAPSPITRPSLTTTAPTSGFGLVWPADARGQLDRSLRC